MKKLLSTFLFASLMFGGLVSGAAATPTRHTVAFENNQLPADVDAAIAAAGGTVVRRIPQIGVVAVESADPLFLQKLGKRPDVYAANATTAVTLPAGETELLVETSEGTAATATPAELAGPGDLYARFGWDIKRVTNDGESFAIETGNKGVVVAVIDSGIDADHPDLRANVVPGSRSYLDGYPATSDSLGHGTQVAGAIAANGRVYGVGPNLGVRSYRVFGAGQSTPSTLIQAAIVDAADDGADVINLSLGGYRDLTDPGQRADAVAYLRAVRYALQRGATVVAASGNDGRDLHNPRKLADSFGLDKGVVVMVPGGLPGLITVSASNKGDALAYYSNYGQGVIELGAPGGDCGPSYPQVPTCDREYRVVTVFPGNRYGFTHGTSHAAPKVSGVAALVIARKGRLGPSRVAHELFKSAADAGRRGRDPQFGSGLVQAVPALRGR